MLPASPKTIVAILRSAYSPAPHPELDRILEVFRRHWIAIGRKRYPSLGEELEDAVQNSLLKLISPEKLERLQDVTRLEAWARSIFVNSVLDLVRDGRRRPLVIATPEEDPEDVLRERLPAEGPMPDETAAYRERLRIVGQCIEKLEVARLKFVDDLSDKEIAARQGLTRDGVAGQLKRVRKSLRAAFRETK